MQDEPTSYRPYDFVSQWLIVLGVLAFLFAHSL